MKKKVFALAVLALILTCVICSLSFLHFSSQLYLKRSPNTFIGDEKYTEVRAEVEHELEVFREQGIEGSINEQVIERVNSKGVTTSLVIFTIDAENGRSGWDLLKADLLPSRILTAVLVLLIIACCLTFTSAVSRTLDGKRLIGGLAYACALAAFILVPVIYLTMNISISRKPHLYLSGSEVKGIETLLPKLDAFLFGGNSGDNLDSLLGALSYTISPVLFALLIPAFLMMCASILAGERSVQKVLLRTLLYVSVILFSAFILYPFFVMFITAFRSNAETTDMYFQNILPVKWMFSNLKITLDRGVGRYLGNSLLIAGGATLVAMLCGIPAAYAMARMDFKGKKAYLGFVIMSQMFPPVVLLVGISRLMNSFRLNDTLLGLVMINAAFNQAFAIWLLRGTFLSISSEMEQAACIDGCSVVGALIRILLPMAAPGIVTTLIFVFINSWNEYIVATVLISTQTNRPITVGITQFSSFNMIEWQYLFAASLLATVPVVILFMLIEKHLAAGLTSGGVKG